MTRLVTGFGLAAALIAAVWYLPPAATLALAIAASLVAFVEYAALAAALGAHVPRVVGGAAVAAACAAVGTASGSIDLVAMGAVVAIGTLLVSIGRPGPSSLRDAAASVLPVLYIGAPLGALAAVRLTAGREALLLLLVTIIASDSAQYYVGRALGRRKLAPSISPAKTVEGAIGGIVVGTAVMTAGGFRLFPSLHPVMLAAAAASIVAIGMVGDLFESLLKRSAGVKDSSSVIPGHGGVLDRIDSWLFAAPVYYALTRYFPS